MNAGPLKYLQQRTTRQFLAPDGSWTEELEQALAIKDIIEALTYCRRYKLSGMDILMKFERDEYDVRLEIGSEAEL